MKKTNFMAKIQSHRRIAIPKINYNTLDLEKGGTVEVTLKKMNKEETEEY